ncbi:MAG: hypothetical protein UIB31_02480 [Methanobrevibacter sp.]|nr:hypothetical protein [Methanobrevibacter sp.]
MDMKNTAILLIFLLCILGLMIGVYQTEGSDDAVNLDNYEEVVLEDSNGTITIQLEPIEKTESFLNRLFT